MAIEKSTKPLDTRGYRNGRKTPEYRLWDNMRSRCYNPKATGYHIYGGRGIGVCDAWRQSFASFITDIGPRPSPLHTLDRINNDGNYEPGNVRWATREEQAQNMRTCRLLTFNGETLTIGAWGRRMNWPDSTLRVRLWSGWSVERALSTPVGGKSAAGGSP